MPRMIMYGKKVLRRALAAVVLFTLGVGAPPALSADSATTSFGRSLFAVLDDSDPLIRSCGWNSLAWLGTASNPNALHTAAFERFLNDDGQALLRHMEALLADVLAHCRAMAAFCRQRVAFENENDAFWIRSRSTIFVIAHGILSTSRRCLHGQSRQGSTEGMFVSRRRGNRRCAKARVRRLIGASLYAKAPVRHPDAIATGIGTEAVLRLWRIAIFRTGFPSALD
jgi:hypothetical protein